MERIVGILNSRGDGAKAGAALEVTALPNGRIALLTPASKKLKEKIKE